MYLETAKFAKSNCYGILARITEIPVVSVECLFVSFMRVYRTLRVYFVAITALSSKDEVRALNTHMLLIDVLKWSTK